jgi:hypothetical protein
MWRCPCMVHGVFFLGTRPRFGGALFLDSVPRRLLCDVLHIRGAHWSAGSYRG